MVHGVTKDNYEALGSAFIKQNGGGFVIVLIGKPMDAEATPFPTPDMTPPTTKTYL